MTPKNHSCYKRRLRTRGRYPCWPEMDGSGGSKRHEAYIRYAEAAHTSTNPEFQCKSQTKAANHSKPLTRYRITSNMKSILLRSPISVQNVPNCRAENEQEEVAEGHKYEVRLETGKSGGSGQVVRSHVPGTARALLRKSFREKSSAHSL